MLTVIANRIKAGCPTRSKVPRVVVPRAEGNLTLSRLAYGTLHTPEFKDKGKLYACMYVYVAYGCMLSVKAKPKSLPVDLLMKIHFVLFLFPKILPSSWPF